MTRGGEGGCSVGDNLGLILALGVERLKLIGRLALISGLMVGLIGCCRHQAAMLGRTDLLEISESTGILCLTSCSPTTWFLRNSVVWPVVVVRLYGSRHNLQEYCSLNS